MVQINFASGEVQCKVVYYGPARAGKTANLRLIHEKSPEHVRGHLTTIATDTDRTLFFDFLPLDLGLVANMRAKVHLYAVPFIDNQNAVRVLVLEGVDGIVFVADSAKHRLEDNRRALDNLRSNMELMKRDSREIPLVFQWNKVDLEETLSADELGEALNPEGHPAFEAVAERGDGVFNTLKACVQAVLIEVANKAVPQRAGAPEPQAPVQPEPLAAPEPQPALPEPVAEPAPPVAAAERLPLPEPEPEPETPEPALPALARRSEPEFEDVSFPAAAAAEEAAPDLAGVAEELAGPEPEPLVTVTPGVPDPAAPLADEGPPAPPELVAETAADLATPAAPAAPEPLPATDDLAPPVEVRPLPEVRIETVRPPQAPEEGWDAFRNPRRAPPLTEETEEERYVRVGGGRDAGWDHPSPRTESRHGGRESLPVTDRRTRPREDTISTASLVAGGAGALTWLVAVGYLVYALL